MAAIEREAARVLDTLIQGVGDESRLSTRSKELAAEEEALRRNLAEAPAPPNVVALHPSAPIRDEAMLSRLQDTLNAGLRTGTRKPPTRSAIPWTRARAAPGPSARARSK